MVGVDGDAVDDAVFDTHPAARTLRAAHYSAGIADVGSGLHPVRDGTAGFGPDQEVPFAAIARLLRETSRADHGPPVQLSGALITGSPVLDHGKITRPLRLVRCVIDVPIRIAGIELAAVELVDCLFTTISVEDVDIDGSAQLTGCKGESIRISSTRVSRSVAFAGTEFTGASPLDLRNLSVGGDFHLEGTVLGSAASVDHASEPAPVVVEAHRLDVGGSILLHDAHVGGGIDLRGAHVDGSVVLAGAEVSGPTDLRAAHVGGLVSVSAARLTGSATLAAFSGDHLTAAAFHADDLVADGAVVLRHATIRDSVSLSGARVSAAPAALRGTGRYEHVTGALVLADIEAGGIRADGCEIDGGVWLPGANVREVSLRRVECTGPLTCEGATVAAGVKLDGSRFVADPGTDPRAVSASRVKVGGRFVFGPTFTADGHVDLAHADTGKSIDLTGAHLRGRLRLFRAHVGSDLVLVGTVIEAGYKEYGVDAIGLRVDGRLTARGLVCDGAVRLTGASADHVVFTGAQVFNPGNVALSGARIEVYGDLVIGDQLDGTDAGGVEIDGRVVLRDARIGGDLVVNEARLRIPGHRVLDTTGASIGGRLAMRHLHAHGMISVDRSTVRRRMVLENIDVDGLGVSTTRGSTSFTALQVTTDEVLIDESRFLGTVRLNGSDISVGVSIRRSTFSGVGDGERLGLHADDLTCARLALVQVNVDGAVQAARVQVGGDLVIAGCAFSDPGRRALDLAGASVGEAIQVKHTTVQGSLSAVRAEVGVGVVLDHLGVDVGVDRNGPSEPADRLPALAMRGIRVQGEVTASEVRTRGEIALDDATLGSVHVDDVVAVAAHRHDRPTGADPVLVFDAHDAEIAGMIDLDRFRVEVIDGAEAVVDLSGMQATTLDVPGGEVIVDLRDARVRTLAIDRDDTAHMILEGFGFDDPGRADVTTALAWLRRDPTGFHHQAYEQLAAHYSRKGDDGAARAVRLARQRHRTELLGTRAAGQALGKVWGWIQDVTVGYGYRPGLAAVWFLGLLAFGTAWFWGRTLDPVEVDVHPTFNPFGYTLDLLIPVFSFGQDSAWDPRGADLVVAYGLIFAGAILATTIAAAVTRVLNRR